MKNVYNLLLHRFARYFVAGTLCILPVVLTVAVVAWLGNLLCQYLGPNTMFGDGLRKVGLQFAANPTAAYLIGAAFVVAIVFLLGVVVEAGARNLIQRMIDATMKRIPIIGNLYGTSKQLVSLLDNNDPSKLQGMKAVFCKFGENCGVLALLVSPAKYRINGRDYQAVIIPTAPVPIGGGLFFMAVDALQPADVSIEALMSIYVSMGVTAGQFLPPTVEEAA